MNNKKIISLMIAVGLFCAVFIWQGVEPVITKLGTAGWSILAVCIFAVPATIGNSEAWRILFPNKPRPSFFKTMNASWIGTSVNNILPVATIGGELVKARILTLWGTPALDSISTMVVDKTVQAITAAVMGLFGVAVFAWLLPDDQRIFSITVMALALVAGIAGFIALQIYGGFSVVARIVDSIVTSDRFKSFMTTASELDAAIRLIYARPGPFIWSCVIRVATQLIIVGEFLLAAYLLGEPIDFVEAVAIKVLVGVAMNAAFAVPGQLGVQEAAYVAMGAVFGYSADLMLAISLAARLRELLPSIPMLFVWQIIEARHLKSQSKSTAESS